MRIVEFGIPSGLDDLEGVQNGKAAWSATISNILDQVIRDKSATQFYNPTSSQGGTSEDETVRELLWTAFPLRLAYQIGMERAMELADDLLERLPLGATPAGTPVQLPVRKQTEYCEWRVTRDAGGRITKVVFTTECHEYWWTLGSGHPPSDYGGPPSGGPQATGDLDKVLALYHKYVSPDVTRDDLVFPEDVSENGQLKFAKGSYNPWNKWNTTHGLMHMSAQDNCLCAFLNQCAGTTTGRMVSGAEVRDATRFLAALHPDRGGRGVNDAADAAIAGVVGSLARAGSMITVRDPVEIVMRQLDTRGWTLPDGSPVKVEDHWQIRRGTDGRALLAEFSPPQGAGYTVSDIRIFGQPIRYGGQIAQCVTVGFDLTAMKFHSVEHKPASAEGKALRLIGSPWAKAETPTALDGDQRYTPLFPESAPTPEPVLDDQDIQGNSLAGFNKNHQWFIGLKITDAKLARRWLETQSYRLSTTAQVAAHNDAYRLFRDTGAERPQPVTWYNLALSAAGLRTLGRTDVDELGSLAFKEGASKRGLYGVGPEPDVLLLLAADHKQMLDAVLGDEAQIRDRAASWGMEVVSFNVGVNVDDKDHFGFKDGISQPGVRGRLSAPTTPFLTARDATATSDCNEPEYGKPGQPLVWPGEFVLGYPRQDMRHPRIPAPAAACTPAWSRNGSYVVFLRFQHDVDGFREYTARRAAETGKDRQMIAAQMVGRWPNGSPLELHPDHPGETIEDRFGYDGDPRGVRCPFTAHIRKVNPRNETTDLGGPILTLRRRILRRGINYGQPSSKDRGLLFLSYQASIEEQLETIFGTWMNDSIRPAGQGPDALLQFSSIKEGGYFFAPSLSALRTLTQ